MADRSRKNEIATLQSEIANEISGDAPEIAQGIFGEARDQPDIVSIPNERLDAIYRQAYERNDRTWLQQEAKRNPVQFLKVAERIGVRKPQVFPGEQAPLPPQQQELASLMAATPPGMPPVAPPPPPLPGAGVPPVAVAPLVPPPPPPGPPMLYGPDGQPLLPPRG